MDIQDEWEVLDRINKSKRKELMAFLREHQGEEAKIIPAVSRDDIPTNSRKDKGTIAFFFVARNIYDTNRMDFFTLIDTLDADKKETLIKLYKQRSTMLKFLGQEEAAPAYDPQKQYVVDREKVGRPKRVLSDTEKAKIDELRAQGKGYNAIAKELKVSNRLIMRHCQKR